MSASITIFTSEISAIITGNVPNAFNKASYLLNYLFITIYFPLFCFLLLTYPVIDEAPSM